MPADTAKYLLTIADLDPKNVEITVFSGVDAISAPYRFDVEFRMSGTTKVPPPDNSLLNKSCRLDIERNGETIPYCGIAVGFSVSDYDDARYTVRIAPRMYRLSLNSTSRIFQNLTVPEIIKNIVYEAELSDYFRIELEPDDIKYPKREYCVQYHESDLAFISRLMEECGIWYYFEQVRQPSGALNECAVVTDVFSEYPKLGRTVPFMKGSGFSEKKDGQLVESVNYLSTKAKLMPRSVRIRNYNHRTPEAAPDGSGDVTGGHLGRVYDYGGAPKNSSEAEHRAGICANRLWVENLRVDGRGNCASFRAGLQAPIMHNSNAALSGLYLLVSVKHSGGWNNGAYTYKNDFSSVRAEPEIYAPPLRTPVPRIDGITTALVGATGDAIPTINECGDYNVNMPFLLNDDKQINNDYGGTKHIRVAQPSSGITAEEERLYGIHFPSKRGAEMVLAYVNGNPDKPVGLGFVPNAAAPSVARNVNCVDNVMRSWGGNELVMNDSHSRENIRLSTPTVRYLELHDGDEFARLKSADSELIFHDAENYAEINVGGHTIHIIYRDKEGDISATTVDGNMIKMNDPENVITVQNAEEENKAVLDGKNKTITFDSVENTLTIYGDDKKIALESKDSKAAVDGSGKKVSFESKDNSLVISGASNSISLNAKGDIILKAGGKIIFDAKSGVSNIGASIDVDPDGSGPGSSPSVVSEQKAASANVRSAARAESGTKKAAGTDGAGGTETGKSSPESTGTDDNDDPKQEVKNMYWTYGEDHIKLEKERSRHYVDLNLHIETKNYEDGENIKIVLRRDDKLPIYDSTAEIPLEGTVIDNHAVVDNVFQERLLNIGLQGDVAEKIVPTVMLPDGTEDVRPEAALDPHRPSWDAVYEGYPLQFRGTDNVKEETKENVFISVLGEKYDTKTFNNACATRVSIALIKSNMRVKKDFLVQVGKHAGQGFIASAKGLQEWLSQENVWNTADVTVDKTDKDTFPGKTNLEIIREKLNGKKGVYIILGGFQKGITGHATLWTGTDVIGGKDDDVEDNTYSSHIDNGATVYFWELKNVPNKIITPTVPRVPQTLVYEAKGVNNASAGEEKVYEVTAYVKDGVVIHDRKMINNTDRDGIRWSINIGGTVQPLNDKKGEKITLTIKNDWAGKTIYVMPHLKKATKSVSVETIVWDLPKIIIVTEQTEGKDKDGNIARDMHFGLMLSNKEHLHTNKELFDTELGTVDLKLQKAIKTDLNLPENKLIERFDRLIMYTSQPPLRVLIREWLEQMGKYRSNVEFLKHMIQLVSKNKIDTYINNINSIDNIGKDPNKLLQTAVLEHRNTKEFITHIDTKIRRLIEENNWDINRIKKNINMKKPRYQDSDDLKKGLRLAINDTWGHQVTITNYRLDPFECDLEIKIFDHFGLDIDDIKKFGLPELVSNDVKSFIKRAALRASNFADIAAEGFRAWFILQHYYGYLPFINIITETHSLDMDITNTTGSIGG